jgi:hypothetical protein
MMPAPSCSNSSGKTSVSSENFRGHWAVGYEKYWKRLSYKTITILPKNKQTDDAAGPSLITLEGKNYNVTGGSFTLELEHESKSQK